MAFNPVLLAAMSDVEPSEAGLASGVVNTSFMMGGALGLAVLASLAASRTGQPARLGRGRSSPRSTGGYHARLPRRRRLRGRRGRDRRALLLRAPAAGAGHEGDGARRPRDRGLTQQQKGAARCSRTAKAFSTFSVDDVPRAKQFYGETLGLNVDDQMDGLGLHLAAAARSSSTRRTTTAGDLHRPQLPGRRHRRRPSTAQRAPVCASSSTRASCRPTRRESSAARGPTIAWFKDPAGNILSVLVIE